MGVKVLEVKGVLECEVVARLNRFVVLVSVGGRRYRAYINNTGRLEEYLVRGRRAYCLENPPGRRTRYRLFAVSDAWSAALIDTQMQMRAFERAAAMGAISWLQGCRVVRRNVRLGSSLIDYLLSCPEGDLYLETKSAVLRGEKRYAMYPDCPTARGRRHIKELIEHVPRGGLGGVVFIAALPEVDAFKPYREGDPEIPVLLREALRVGVIVKAIAMHFEPAESAVYLDDPDLRVELDDSVAYHDG